jgi:hypothetical protein
MSGPHSPRLSRSVTILIAVVWAGLFGALVKDRVIPSAGGAIEPSRIAAVEADDWFAVRIRGAFAGFGRSRQWRRDNHWTLKDDLHISLNIQGFVKPIRIVCESDVDDDFRLLAFSLKVSSGIVSFEQKGRMEGRDLVITGLSSSKGAERRLKLHESPMISRSLGLPIPLTGLRVGEEFQAPVFDPLDGRKWDAELRVLEQAALDIGGKSVEAWLVRAAFRSVDLAVWVDGEGRLLKGSLPMGITVVRSTKEEVSRLVLGKGDLPDMAALSAVPVEGEIPHPRTLSFLRIKMQGVEEKFIASDNFRQTRSEGGVVTISEPPLPEAGYTAPYSGKEQAEFLESSRFIRSDAPEIIEKAKEIIGPETNPVKAAHKINTWVSENLKKTPTPSIPDAVVVLRTREGDCNEHSVLSAALARAVGIPAQTVMGLVYLDEAFYYHAWVVYWAGGRWFTGDPLMNQMPVDASHVALIYGDVDKSLNVIRFVGRLTVEVLEASDTNASPNR